MSETYIIKTQHSPRSASISLGDPVGLEKSELVQLPGKLEPHFTSLVNELETAVSDISLEQVKAHHPEYSMDDWKFRVAGKSAWRERRRFRQIAISSCPEQAKFVDARTAMQKKFEKSKIMSKRRAKSRELSKKKKFSLRGAGKAQRTAPKYLGLKKTREQLPRLALRSRLGRDDEEVGSEIHNKKLKRLLADSRIPTMPYWFAKFKRTGELPRISKKELLADLDEFQSDRVDYVRFKVKCRTTGFLDRIKEDQPEMLEKLLVEGGVEKNPGPKQKRKGLRFKLDLYARCQNMTTMDKRFTLPPGKKNPICVYCRMDKMAHAVPLESRSGRLGVEALCISHPEMAVHIRRITDMPELKDMVVVEVDDTVEDEKVEKKVETVDKPEEGNKPEPVKHVSVKIDADMESPLISGHTMSPNTLDVLARLAFKASEGVDKRIRQEVGSSPDIIQRIGRLLIRTFFDREISLTVGEEFSELEPSGEDRLVSTRGVKRIDGKLLVSTVTATKGTAANYSLHVGLFLLLAAISVTPFLGLVTFPITFLMASVVISMGLALRYGKRTRSIELMYVPHVVSETVRLYKVDASLTDVKTTCKGKFERLGSLPISQSMHTVLMSGTVLAVMATNLTAQDFWKRPLMDEVDSECTERVWVRFARSLQMLPRLRR